MAQTATHVLVNKKRHVQGEAYSTDERERQRNRESTQKEKKRNKNRKRPAEVSLSSQMEREREKERRKEGRRAVQKPHCWPLLARCSFVTHAHTHT